MQLNKYTHTHTHTNNRALLFRTRIHLCRQRVALAGTRQLRSQGLGPVHAHLTEGVTRSEGREGTNGVGGEIGVGDGNGDVHRVGGGNGAGTGTGVEANEGAQNGNEDVSGDGVGTGTGTRMEIRRRTQDGNGDGSGDGNESSSGDGTGHEDENGNGNEYRIGGGGRESKKRLKPHKSCRRHVEKGGNLGGKRKECRKERVGTVAANRDNLENIKAAGGGAQGAQGFSKNCTSGESVSPLSRLIRGFRNKYH